MNKTKLRIAVVVPHLFMQDYYLKNAIFSPGHLAVDLCSGLISLGHSVTLFSPNKVTIKDIPNITSDYSLIEKELTSRGYGLNELMAKHPLTYITFARQLEAEIINKAYSMANSGEFDVVHIYINEEDIAMQFANLCNKPVVFTHHEPFNFLTRYRTSFEHFKHLNWLSISYSQRKTISTELNWIANIYHGIEPVNNSYLKSLELSTEDYVVFFGRVIEPKGVHLAIKAVKELNKQTGQQLKLKIAGKHYSDQDDYWQEKILPFIDNQEVEYIGFINNELERDKLLYNSKAMIMPSTWSEPFGMVILESLRLGTPVIGFNSGALPEIIKNNVNGLLSNIIYKDNKIDEDSTVSGLVNNLKELPLINKKNCIESCNKNFSIKRMVTDHLNAYSALL